MQCIRIHWLQLVWVITGACCDVGRAFKSSYVFTTPLKFVTVFHFFGWQRSCMLRMEPPFKSQWGTWHNPAFVTANNRITRNWRNTFESVKCIFYVRGHFSASNTGLTLNFDNRKKKIRHKIKACSSFAEFRRRLVTWGVAWGRAKGWIIHRCLQMGPRWKEAAELMKKHTSHGHKRARRRGKMLASTCGD